jgi:hypothetical protein
MGTMQLLLMIAGVLVGALFFYLDVHRIGGGLARWLCLILAVVLFSLGLAPIIAPYR